MNISNKQNFSEVWNPKQRAIKLLWLLLTNHDFHFVMIIFLLDKIVFSDWILLGNSQIGIYKKKWTFFKDNYTLVHF